MLGKVIPRQSKNPSFHHMDACSISDPKAHFEGTDVLQQVSPGFSVESETHYIDHMKSSQRETTKNSVLFDK